MTLELDSIHLFFLTQKVHHLIILLLERVLTNQHLLLFYLFARILSKAGDFDLLILLAVVGHEGSYLVQVISVNIAIRETLHFPVKLTLFKNALYSFLLLIQLLITLNHYFILLPNSFNFCFCLPHHYLFIPIPYQYFHSGLLIPIL